MLEYKQLKDYCRLTYEAQEILKAVFDANGYSARYYTRVLRAARTIADMEIVAEIINEKRTLDDINAYDTVINEAHIAEAIKYKASEI